MYEVIYMKADAEPWWMFEGWETSILSREAFQTKIDAEGHLESLLTSFRSKFSNEQRKKQCFYAFWADEEKIFCEACDDDLQTFHGLFILYEGKPVALFN